MSYVTGHQVTLEVIQSGVAHALISIQFVGYRLY